MGFWLAILCFLLKLRFERLSLTCEWRYRRHLDTEESAAVAGDGQDRQQAGGVTDATGKGLAPVWRDPCAGPNRYRRPAAAHGDTPMLRWPHGTMGESKPRPRLRRLVGGPWIVERRPAA